MTLLRLSKSGNRTEFRGNFHRHLQDRCTSMLFNLAIIIFQKVRPNNPPCSCVSAKSTSIPLICLVKPVITYNLPAYQVLEPSWDALKMRYAAIHIVKLPITVRAPWRATRTYGSRKKKHCIVTQRQTIGAEELFGIIFGLDYAFVYFHDNNKGLQII